MTLAFGTQGKYW